MAKTWKRCGWGLSVLLWLGTANLLHAQTTDTEKAAVNLGSGAKVRNTIIWKNGGKPLLGTTDTLCLLVGKDPLFVSEESGKEDFRLTETSPFINAGTTAGLALPAADLWGNDRLIGGSVDIGAHEFKVYVVHFDKSPYVEVVQRVGDSLGIVPGGTYSFQLIVNIAEVKKVTIEESGATISPSEGNIYTISNINSDKTVKVELDPPVTVSLVEPAHGNLTASNGTTTLPAKNGSGGKQLAMQVSEGTQIALDTTADAGYYCKAVWAQVEGETDKQDAMAYVGVARESGWKAEKNVAFSAEFGLRSYPVTVAWIPAEGGSVSLTKEGGSAETLSASPYSVSLPYESSFAVSATAAAHYRFDSIVYRDKSKHTQTSPSLTQKVPLDGMQVEVYFSLEKYPVTWTATHGTLSVTATKVLRSGDQVEYGTTLSVVPTPDEGYELAGLTALPSGGGEVRLAEGIAGNCVYTVVSAVELKPVFEKKKYGIDLSTNTPDVAGNTISCTPALADGKAEHGAALTLSMAATAGYRYDSLTLDGKKVSLESAYCVSKVEGEMSFKAWFSRIPYVINYNAPAGGTLVVEVQDQGATDWRSVASGATAYYGDQLRATATANTGYRLKTLTVNGASFVSGNAKAIDADQTVFAEFEPLLYDLTVEKVTDPSGDGKTVANDKGGLRLTDATGKEWGALGLAESSKTIPNVPYGTRIVATQTSDEEGYGMDVLDTLVSGQAKGSIWGRNSFVLSEATTLQVRFVQTTDRYAVRWTVERRGAAYAGDTVQVYKGTEALPNDGTTYLSGTALTVKTTTEAGDTCLSLTDQNGNAMPAAFVLTQDVTLKAVFAPLCTLRINPPKYAAIVVKKDDGTELQDGALIPAGTSLTAELSVKAEHRDSVRAMAMALDGIEERDLWRFDGAVGASAPVASGAVSYGIPETARGEVIFGGTTEVYYRVRVVSPSNGSLTAMREGAALPNDADRWFKGGTQLALAAEENEGYAYRGTSNTAVSPEEPIALAETAAGRYEGTVTVDRHLTLAAEFEQRMCTVELRVDPESSAVARAEVKADGAAWLSLLTLKGEKPYGTMLAVEAEPAVGYGLAAILGGAETIGEASGVSLRLTQDTVITVALGKKYQVHFKETELEVKRGSELLADGAYVPQGAELAVAFKEESLQEGKECVEIDTTVNGATGKLEEAAFVMPAADVYLEAKTDWKKYELVYRAEPAAYGTIRIEQKADDGTWTAVAGDSPLSGIVHGTVLRAVVERTEDETGKTDTRYNLDAVTCVVDGTSNSLTWIESGRDCVCGEWTMTGDAEVVARLQQKMNLLYVDIEAPVSGFQVRVKTSGGEEQVFEADGSWKLPVGEIFEAEPVIPDELADAYEVKSFPSASEKLDFKRDTMPERVHCTVAAVFGLKEFKVYLNWTPTEGGTIVAQDAEGALYGNGSTAKYGTELDIEADVASDYYRLAGCVARMGEESRTDSARYELRLTDTLRVDARFERVYRVLSDVPEHGTFEVLCADTNAVGSYYPAGTELAVRTMPETGYEVKALQVNDKSQGLYPDGDGVIRYTVPENTAVNDLLFQVAFRPIRYKVRFIVDGKGELLVEGMEGGTRIYANDNEERDVEYGTELHLAALPSTEGEYRIYSFQYHDPSDQVSDISGSETGIRVEGDIVVYVEYRKYYHIFYEQPEEGGTLVVTSEGKPVEDGSWWPGGTDVKTDVNLEEGYDVDYLFWTGGKVANHAYFTIPEEASYTDIVISTGLKIQEFNLFAEHPDGGYIEVERYGADGEWQPLEVQSAVPTVLEYGTRLRARVAVLDPKRSVTSGVTLNEYRVISEGGEWGEWNVREDGFLRGGISPRTYRVAWEQPEYGTIRVFVDGEEIRSDTALAYETELEIVVEPEDPDGYEQKSLTANDAPVEDGAWTVEDDTEIRAVIGLKQWRVTAEVAEGEGQIRLIGPQGELDIAGTVVDHYARIRVEAQPDGDWTLYRVEVSGAYLEEDSTFVVEGDVQVKARFREREKLQFPAVFTPNGDGQNDTWAIKGLWQYPQNKLEIYNRQQRRVYKASPYGNEWNGETEDGDILPAGTYVYRFTTESGEEYVGLVSIVRN